MSTSSTQATPLPKSRRIPADPGVASWLLACCALVFCMVLLGGVTRLTDSGLSMVRWEPASGILPPLSQSAWEDEFDHYREYPEYRKVNTGMSLAEFKTIFYFEYAHRVLGRSIGLVFALGFVYFLWRRRLPPALAPHLIAMFALGGLQGLLGWYMVKSGLIDVPQVSQYRLVAHLGAAIGIYLYMLWVAFGLLEHRPAPAVTTAIRRAVRGLGLLALITVLSGGFVAGLKAGHAFNTFPLMAGQWIPPGYIVLDPVWLNFFENIPTVQFNHRVLAISTFILTLVLVWRIVRDPRLESQRGPAWLLAGVATVQVALGISTLLMHVPVALAAAHQGMALGLLSVILYLIFKLRHSVGR